MDAPISMTEVIFGLRYSVETATLLADDVYWDGRNMERSGRNCFLYHTPNGRYFSVTVSMWQGERQTLTPLTLDEATELWRQLPERHVKFDEAFPGVDVEEA